MSSKFHLTPTGQARTCNAKTPESCKYSKLSGEVVEHYNSKEDAQAAYELEQEKNGNSNRPLKKTSIKKVKTADNESVNWKEIAKTSKLMNNVLTDPVLNSHAYSLILSEPSTSDEITKFYDVSGDQAETLSELSTYKPVSHIQQVDYRGQTLAEKNGQHYIFHTYEDSWDDKIELLNYTPVQKVEKEQINTEYTHVDKISDPDIQKMMKEHYRYNAQQKKYRAPYFWDSKEQSDIIVQNISAEGDSSIMDELQELKIDYTPYENEEKQNARVMEIGTVVFNKKINKGFMHTHMSASDGYPEDDGLKIDNKGNIKPTEGSLYVITGTGAVLGTGWKPVEQ